MGENYVENVSCGCKMRKEHGANEKHTLSPSKVTHVKNDKITSRIIVKSKVLSFSSSSFFFSSLVCCE